MKRLSVVINSIIFIIMIESSLLPRTGEEKGTKGTDGFGDIKWGAKAEEVKGKVLGKIVYYDEKRAIITKDNHIQYLYGFFLLESQPDIKSGKEKEVGKEQNGAASGTGLFYVSVLFPYLAMKDVRKRIEGKYGPPTGENLKDNQGAIIWDFDKTTIIMWVERYDDSPFCRKINYIGKELAKEINEYQRMIFNKTEIAILKKLPL